MAALCHPDSGETSGLVPCRRFAEVTKMSEVLGSGVAPAAPTIVIDRSPQPG
jgi:hypothetical protein